MPWPRTIPHSGTVKTDPKAFPWVMVAETTLPSASAAETWLVSGRPPPAAKGRWSTWSGKFSRSSTRPAAYSSLSSRSTGTSTKSGSPR